jgi:capsule polysaccharide modification protein KpsS
MLQHQKLCTIISKTICYNIKKYVYNIAKINHETWKLGLFGKNIYCNTLKKYYYSIKKSSIATS